MKENLTRNNVIRFIIAVVLAGIVKEFLHTNIGIPAPSYNKFIDLMAYITSPLGSALGVSIIYYLLGDRLPAKSIFVKGILLGLLVLLAEGELIRQPLMNLLLPNTFREILLIQLQVWLSNLAMAIIIALIIKPKYAFQEKE